MKKLKQKALLEDLIRRAPEPDPDPDPDPDPEPKPGPGKPDQGRII